MIDRAFIDLAEKASIPPEHIMALLFHCLASALHLMAEKMKFILTEDKEVCAGFNSLDETHPLP